MRNGIIKIEDIERGGHIAAIAEWDKPCYPTKFEILGNGPQYKLTFDHATLLDMSRWVFFYRSAPGFKQVVTFEDGLKIEATLENQREAIEFFTKYLANNYNTDPYEIFSDDLDI